MTGATTQQRPDTPIGRALADRVLSHLSPEPATSGITVDLTHGEPVPTPAHVGQTAKTALDEGETHYTDASGIPELRAAVARHLAALGFAVEPEGVGITNGGTEAIYIALQVALKPGDRVAIVEPVLEHIVDMVEFIGAEPLRVETSAANGFVPDPASIAQSNARVLLIASPSPVTGLRIPDDRLEAIVAAARANEMAVILDLAHAAGLYEPAPVRFADPQLAEEIVLTGSLSTAHGLAGWRVGFFSAPAADRGLHHGLKAAMSICTTAVSQHAAVAALDEPGEWFAARRAHFAANRDLAVAQLEQAGISYVNPDAFSSLLIDVSHLGGGDAVARKLAARGVLVDSGSSFGASTLNFIRINLGAPEDALTSGIRRLTALNG